MGKDCRQGQTSKYASTPSVQVVFLFKKIPESSLGMESLVLQTRLALPHSCFHRNTTTFERQIFLPPASAFELSSGAFPLRLE